MILDERGGPRPVLGILSLVLGPGGLVAATYFGSTSAVAANYALFWMLGAGIVAGLVGVLRREQPRWVAAGGMLVSLTIAAAFAGV